MGGADEQALILGALVGLSVVTLGFGALVWWWLK